MKAPSKTAGSRLFSPREVARALGVSEASVKRWCDGGEFRMVKTPGGHRRISLSALVEHLRRTGREVESPEAVGLPAPISREERRDEAALRRRFLASLEAGAYEGIRKVAWSLWLDGGSIAELCDDLIAPAFWDVGARWSHGETEVYQERRACDLAVRLIDDLRSALPHADARAPAAVGGTLEGDPYELPTKMVETSLAERGWRAQSLGAGIPSDSLAKAIADEAPRLLWISVSAFESLDALSASMDAISGAAGEGCAVAVGGRALTDDVRRRLKYSFFGDGMGHLVRYANSIARSARRLRARGSKSRGPAGDM